MLRYVVTKSRVRLVNSHPPVLGVSVFTQKRQVKTSEKFNIVNRPKDYNPRNNAGFLNNCVHYGTQASRRGVFLTVGVIDQLFKKDYCNKFFSFSRHMVKGFWRWYAAAIVTKNVLLYKYDVGPETYRELVDYNLTLDSLRGLPVISCMFLPFGFVALGSALYFLPTWLVLPRTFWSTHEIRVYLKRQYAERKYAVPIIRKFVPTYTAEGYKDRGLEDLPYEVLRALASGHGFYLATKIPIPCILRYRLKRFARNISKQDALLKQECLVNYLTQRELDWACYRRGFFPHSMLENLESRVQGTVQRQEQEKYLLNWVRNTASICPETQTSELMFRIMLSDIPSKSDFKM